MEIFTVTMTKESFSDPPVMDVFGSFMDGKRAKEFLVDKIVNMSLGDEVFSEVLWDDENHQDLREEVSRATGIGVDMLPPHGEAGVASIEALRNYLDGEIGCGTDGGCYYMYSATAYDRDATFRFDITRNTLED